MIGLLIKYFVVINCSFNIYTKLLNRAATLSRLAVNSVLSLFLAFVAYYIRSYATPLLIPFLILISIVYLTQSTKTKLELSITTTILSFGISYASFYLLIFFLSIIFQLFKAAHSSENINVITFCALIIQFLLTYVLFKFRRLKSGMPFLKNKGSSNTGVFISVLLLCCVTIFTNHNNSEFVYIVPVVLILLCGVFILFWWRGKLTKTYIERLRSDELSYLKGTIQDQDTQIKNLKEQNDALARIIHKDNKLLPAMGLAVKDYLESYDESYENSRRKGQELLTQLNIMLEERSGALRDYQLDNGKLPLTNVLSIDSLMKFMFNKAKENGVILELTLAGSVTFMVENIISDSELRTLLADLIENAIIATKASISKKILVFIGISNSSYLINVMDSGIPFEVNTIVDLGLKRATTHADDGGSGIGLVMAYQVIKEHHASFIIEEYSGNNIYTKKLSVKFDGLEQYIVKSDRYNEIRSLSPREELVLLKA